MTTKPIRQPYLKLVCPDCGADLDKCNNLKLIVCLGELTINCPLCCVVGVPVDIRDGWVMNRKSKESQP